jgi:glucose-6-phosphate 1-dehydrogenase
VLGDATLFMRADQVEKAWRLITLVLESWQQTRSADFANYAAGLCRPESVEVLIAQEARSWVSPTMT